MGEQNCYKTDAQDCIKKQAYYLWGKDGHKQGRDLEHWLIAIRQWIPGNNIEKQNIIRQIKQEQKNEKNFNDHDRYFVE